MPRREDADPCGESLRCATMWLVPGRRNARDDVRPCERPGGQEWGGRMSVSESGALHTSSSSKFLVVFTQGTQTVRGGATPRGEDTRATVLGHIAGQPTSLCIRPLCDPTYALARIPKRAQKKKARRYIW